MEEQLIKAAGQGNLDEVQRLVEREYADPNAKRKLWTPLLFACSQHQIAVIEYLVEVVQVDIDARNARGDNALHITCVFGYSSLVRYLVEIGDVNINAKNEIGRTPLHNACCEGSMEVVGYLVEQQHANVMVKDNSGKTPLRAVLDYPPQESNRRDDVVRCLLSKMPSVDEIAVHRAWELDLPWTLKEMVLEKYAIELQVAEEYPIHMIFEHFPFLSKEPFRDCINHFTSSLILSDDQGRFPIHRALSSTNPNVKSMETICTLVEREPRLCLLRHPATGMYPYQTAASHVPTQFWGDNNDWLNVVYKLLRSNPEGLLRSGRKIAGNGWEGIV